MNSLDNSNIYFIQRSISAALIPHLKKPQRKLAKLKQKTNKKIKNTKQNKTETN